MLKQNWAVQCCWRLESWQVKKVPAQHARLTLVESSNRGRDPQAAGWYCLVYCVQGYGGRSQKFWISEL